MLVFERVILRFKNVNIFSKKGLIKSCRTLASATFPIDRRVRLLVGKSFFISGLGGNFKILSLLPKKDLIE